MAIDRGVTRSVQLIRMPTCWHAVVMWSSILLKQEWWIALNPMSSRVILHVWDCHLAIGWMNQTLFGLWQAAMRCGLRPIGSLFSGKMIHSQMS